MTNKNNTTLYTGVTNNILRRLEEHKNGINKYTFTKRYNINKLVYIESYSNGYDAIHREKQLKAGSRQKKIDCINSLNPEWKDLESFI